MRTIRTRCSIAAAAAVFLALVACSSDDGPTDPNPNPPGSNGINTVATPPSATIARGGTTTTTVTFTTFGGATLGSTTINRQFAGITVTQTSTQTEGATTTRTYTIGADNTIAAGSHEIRFIPSVSGGANESTTINSATFVLTVTP